MPKCCYIQCGLLDFGLSSFRTFGLKNCFFLRFHMSLKRLKQTGVTIITFWIVFYRYLNLLLGGSTPPPPLAAVTITYQHLQNLRRVYRVLNFFFHFFLQFIILNVCIIVCVWVLCFWVSLLMPDYLWLGTCFCLRVLLEHELMTSSSQPCLPWKRSCQRTISFPAIAFFPPDH